MKTKQSTQLTCLMALLFSISSLAAATFDSGYTQGSGSQLLSTNGGAGSQLFIDGARLGGGDSSGNPFQFPEGNSVYLDGTSLWNIGDQVSITGFAMPLRAIDTPADTTFTFTVREGLGGSGPSGGGGGAILGSPQTGSFTKAGAPNVSAYFINFDEPVIFTASANTANIGISFETTDNRFGFKTQPAGTTDTLPRYNYANGNFVGSSAMAVSVAGTVIPEASSFALLGGLLAFGFVMVRRRSA